jgi:hypothetical protein
VKESDYAIWTFSRFSDTARDSLGRRIRIFSRRRVHDSPAADFCRDLIDRPFVHKQRQDRLRSPAVLSIEVELVW